MYIREHSNNSEEADICDKVKEYIDIYYGNNQLSAIFLGDMMDMTPYYLSTIFKDKYQLSIPDYIAKVRITHAKEQLRYSNDTIAKIAQVSGFTGSNSFIRVFKRLEGMTPGVYRELFKEKELLT